MDFAKPPSRPEIQCYDVRRLSTASFKMIPCYVGDHSAPVDPRSQGFSCTDMLRLISMQRTELLDVASLASECFRKSGGNIFQLDFRGR